MQLTVKKELITKYIAGYNAFDVEGMLSVLSDDIIFVNMANGEETHRLQGIAAFRQQAQEATQLFTSRKQTITDWVEADNGAIHLDISYHAILAQDLPNGMKIGQTVTLTGKSVFNFNGTKICQVTDIS